MVNGDYTPKKIIVGFTIRLLVYLWIVLNVLLRVHGWGSYSVYALLGFALFVSIVMTIYKIDKKIVLKFIFDGKKSKLLLGMFFLLWLQILVEWMVNVGGHESYMYYEPIMVALGAPSSFIVALLNGLFDFQVVKPYTVTHVVLTWGCYCGFAMFQYLVLFKMLRKRIRTKNSETEKESGHP